MAAFDIKIWLEPLLSTAGGAEPKDWLGQVLTVSLEARDEDAALPSDPASLTALRTLLTPWEWTLAWTGAKSVSDAAGSFDPDALQAYLDTILGLGGHQAPADALHLLKFPGPETELKDESVPNWPLLLAQLARLGPQVSHPLKLAHLFNPDETGPKIELESVSIEIAGVSHVLTVGGPPMMIGGDDYSLKCANDASNLPAPSDVTGLIGLIHPVERLVHFPSGKDEATAGWLAELPYRLGQAIDPLARIPDLLEIDPEAFSEGLQILRVLPEVFGPPTAVAPILVAVLAVDAGSISQADLEKMEVFAAHWAERFALPGDPTSPEPGVKRSELTRLLGYGDGNGQPGPDATRPSPEALRAAYAGGAYAGGDLAAGVQPTLDDYVRQALEAALHRRSEESPALVERATRWLKDPANVSQFIRGLLPEALARRTLYPALINAVKADADDWKPMKAAFAAMDTGYAPTLARLLGIPPQTIPDSIVTHEAERVFQTEREGVDRGAETGLPFRVDTIFHQPTELSDAEQLHAMLDGYVVAISPGKLGGWDDWKLVTAGRARLIKGDSPPPQAAPDGVEVTTPLQVGFEAPFALDKEAEPALEIRNAAASYHGRAMIPWSSPSPGRANDEGDDAPPVQVDYTPSQELSAYPPLAYGQDYRIACGYQAPGGVLPMGFAESASPWKFKADDAFLSEPHRHQIVAFRRTLVPGAPRLLAKGGRSSLVVAAPGDERVRPLWKEHVARWPTRHAALRKKLDETPTLFLDPLRGKENDPAGFDFEVAPPALALGEQDDHATNAAVWRYWIERDRQLGSGASLAAIKRSKQLEVEDPAVVGGVSGQPDGAGGVRFSLLRVMPGGPEYIKVPEGALEALHRDIVLKPEERISVRVESASSGTEPALTSVGPKVTVTLPLGQRFILEARTLCDARFMAGGDDERFSQSVTARTFGAAADGKVAFGAVSLAIEVLPEEDHLPTPEQLWAWLDLGNERAVRAMLKTEPSSGLQTPPEDYIDHVRLTHQLYAPDGGPVPDLHEFGIPLSADGWPDRSEQVPAGKDRDPAYVAFEAAMFLGRGMAGMETVARRVSGRPTELLALDLPRNRGADYLRARLSVTSRYAAIRARSDADGQYLRRLARTGKAGSEWKGRTISLLRGDELPTPRIAAAAPLFASLTFADDARQTGGVALYLDHEAYNTRTGAGLAETLEASIVIETLQTDAGTTAALAVGADPVLHDGAVGPFINPQTGKPVAGRISPAGRESIEGSGRTPRDGHAIGEPGSEEMLLCSAIMGQTLEPNSAAPRFPYSVAFLEPALNNGLALGPNTMARIRVRTATQGSEANIRRSPWSAPIWIHFLPDRESLRPSGAIASRSSAGNGITVNLGDRWADYPTAEETAGASQKGPLLRRRIWAALMRATRNAAGDPIMRLVKMAPPGDADRSVLSFRDDDAAATHIRLLDVQIVDEGGGDPAGDQWFFEPSKDSGRRIVGVGPLIEITAAAGDPET